MGAAAVVLLALLVPELLAGQLRQSESAHDRIQAIMAQMEAEAAAREREKQLALYEEGREFQRRSRELVESWTEFVDLWNRGIVSVKSAERFEKACDRLRNHPLWPKQPKGKRRKGGGDGH